MKIAELRKKRAQLIAQARSILDANPDGLSQEVENQYNTIMGEVEKLANQIQREQRLAEIEADLEQPDGAGLRPQPENRNQPGQPARRNETPEYRAVVNRYLAGGFEALRPEEQRALQADLDIYGGYMLAPVTMAQGILQAVDNAVYLRQWGTPNQVNGAADGLGVVSLDNDPADPTWTAEIAIGTDDSTMSFGGRELKPHPLSKLIKVSRKLLRKAPSAEDMVQRRLAYKFAVTVEATGMTGTGANQPLGIFTASAQGINTDRDVSTGNTTTSITFDGLIEAKYTLKSNYWPKARWLFHVDALKQIAKLKDGDGQYVWRESVRAGEPDRLLNVPCFSSYYAPNTFTTGLYVGMIADFSYYWWADDLNMEIQRLAELYAATNQIGFIGRMELDGMPVLSEAFVRVKLA
jgi:HK97 family phage major capsid protein